MFVVYIYFPIFSSIVLSLESNFNYTMSKNYFYVISLNNNPGIRVILISNIFPNFQTKVFMFTFIEFLEILLVDKVNKIKQECRKYNKLINLKSNK